MLRNIGTTEWIIIAVVILLLFGGKKIPEFFKGIGEAVREFKKSSKNDDEKTENWSSPHFAILLVITWETPIFLKNQN